MRFQQCYSSSNGNLYVITSDNGERLLLECGVVWKVIQAALEFDLSNIVGCLLTHEHQDHAKAVTDVIKAGIPLYTSAGTAEALNLSGRRVNTVEAMAEFYAGPFRVIPFNVIHDCKQPFGYIIHCDSEWLLFATDTAYLKQQFCMQFRIIAIECSYDKDVLSANVESGEVNESLAKRLLDSHMEKSVTERYLNDFCNLSKCQELHLLHLSGRNIGDKELVRDEFSRKFMLKTVIV